ncbi:Hypothetical predicted protein [Olea europaea subsp. europaea]|uniref:Uncharacterized protein n=1 Tax=Olea europaea subsp. europaea TaxID=158383 RepID=A0A8S0PQZ6_OLEEU|nr:Hypothetical predicted protein [Olea europaea subsp. europaea]
MLIVNFIWDEWSRKVTILGTVGLRGPIVQRYSQLKQPFLYPHRGATTISKMKRTLLFVHLSFSVISEGE